MYDLIPETPRSMYFPGDDLLLLGGNSESVKKSRSERASKVSSFVRSGDFPRQILVTCISSLPRWHFIRALNSANDEENGLRHAIEELVADTRKIVWEINPLAERLLEEVRIPPRPMNLLGLNLTITWIKTTHCSSICRLFYGAFGGFTRWDRRV